MSAWLFKWALVHSMMMAIALLNHNWTSLMVSFGSVFGTPPLTSNKSFIIPEYLKWFHYGKYI
jgi:hypothetical protein